MSTAAAPRAQSNEPILLRDDRDGIARLTLNRPKKYNALSEAMIDALQSALDDIGADKSIRVVVLAANGPAFCAGHDLGEMRATPDEAYYRALFDKCSRMMLTIARIPQPVIARVHGIATAAGCQLVAACDMAVAEDGARFATPGHQAGPVLLDAVGRGVARGRTQGGVRDAVHRRFRSTPRPPRPTA